MDYDFDRKRSHNILSFRPDEADCVSVLIHMILRKNGIPPANSLHEQESMRKALPAES
jgi:hypothetical protein